MQWEAWETATAWRAVYKWNGQARQTFFYPPFSDEEYTIKTPPGAAPPEGSHWWTISRSSRSAPGATTPPVCDKGELNQSYFTDYVIYITVADEDKARKEARMSRTHRKSTRRRMR